MPNPNPSPFTPGLGEEICARVAAGQSWREIEDAVGVTQRTVQRWVRTLPEFRGDYNDACTARAETDVMNLPETVQAEKDAQRAKVLADTIKWRASHWARQRYGDKIAVEVEHKVSLAAAIEAGERQWSRRERMMSLSVDDQMALLQFIKAGDTVGANTLLEARPVDPTVPLYPDPDFMS